MHHPLITFRLGDRHEHVEIRIVCEDGALLTIVPTAHLGSLAVALVGACNFLGIGLSQATVLPFESSEARREVEQRTVHMQQQEEPVEPDQ